MAIKSIHLGPIEDYMQFDDTEFYSDGVTPRGLIVPVKPTTDNGVIRKQDLVDSSVNPLADNSYIVVSLSGNLNQERALAVGVGLVKTDGGANGSLTLAVKQQSAIASLVDNSGGVANDTVQSLTDPVDSPASADALRDDLVANLVPELRNNFADLTAKVNAILIALRNAEVITT
jgi:hypothetical protein